MSISQWPYVHGNDKENGTIVRGCVRYTAFCGERENNMLKYLKKYWIFALLAPLFMMGEVAMDLVQPQLMRTIVDEGVLGIGNGGVGDLSLVVATGIRMILFVALGGLCGVLSGVCANICGQNFGNDVRKDAFGKIMSLSFEQTDRFSTGSLITRVTNDITQVQHLVMMSMRGFVRTFMLFAGGIFCMVNLQMSFGKVVACAMPLVVICAMYFILRVNPKYGILQGKLDYLNNVMQENVAGSRVVKAYVQEEREKKRFGAANDDLVNTQLDILLLLALMTPIMNIILNVSVVAVIKVGAIEVQEGNVTPGDVMAAITYISQILNAVMRMTMIFQTVSRGTASGKRIMEVIQCVPTIQDGSFDGETTVKGKVEFRNVSFVYPNASEKILDGISFTINPGETVAILGETGSGKTSLINLIPRFYDAIEGQVLVDDIDVRDYPVAKLRDKIAVVLQKSEIFSQSIGENIRWGREKATNEEVKKAAQIAQAMEFIEERENKFEASVNQGGTSLSGGQKQRVAISRAVLKNSEIMILDDSTSALDLKTEAKFYEALKKSGNQSTKILVAQRIASIKDADRIFILDNGKIAACGKHEELLNTSPIYQDIYNSQLKDGGDENGRE